MYEICSKWTIETLERCYWRYYGDFIVSFVQISHIVLVFFTVDFEQVNASWVDKRFCITPVTSCLLRKQPFEMWSELRTSFIAWHSVKTFQIHGFCLTRFSIFCINMEIYSQQSANLHIQSKYNKIPSSIISVFGNFFCGCFWYFCYHLFRDLVLNFFTLIKRCFRYDFQALEKGLEKRLNLQFLTSGIICEGVRRNVLISLFLPRWHLLVKSNNGNSRVMCKI